MNLRTVSVAIGAGITAFLLVTALVIELLPFEFSALVGLVSSLGQITFYLIQFLL